MLDVVDWTLDFGREKLDVGPWTLNVGRRWTSLDVVGRRRTLWNFLDVVERCWTLKVGRSAVGCRALDVEGWIGRTFRRWTFGG